MNAPLNPMRRGACPALSAPMLTGDGLLVRHYFPEVPPRVEYELTDMGASMLPALEGFTSWIRENWPQIAEARTAYDEAQK